VNQLALLVKIRGLVHHTSRIIDAVVRIFSEALECESFSYLPVVPFWGVWHWVSGCLSFLLMAITTFFEEAETTRAPTNSLGLLSERKRDFCSAGVECKISVRGGCGVPWGEVEGW